MITCTYVVNNLDSSTLKTIFIRTIWVFRAIWVLRINWLTWSIHVIDRHEELTEEEGAFLDKYFEENVYPVLTPMAVDSSRPFPLVAGNVALFRMRALRVRYGLAGPFSLGGDLRLSVCYAFLTCGIG